MTVAVIVLLAIFSVAGVLLLAALAVQLHGTVRAVRGRRRIRLEQTLAELRLQQLTQHALVQLMAEARQRLAHSGRPGP